MIRDSGVSGNGSLYGSRFKAGDVISASQLNDLNSGLMQGTVQPYLGAGVVTAYGAGGTQVLYNPDLPIGEVQQHQVVVAGNNLQVAYGRILAQDFYETHEYTTQAFGAYPTGSVTTGSDYFSPFINLGGYVTLTPGTNYWVVLLRNQVGLGGYGATFCFAPCVAVLPDGGDGYTKSTPWNFGTDRQVAYSVNGGLISVDIIDPSSIDPIPGAIFGNAVSTADDYFAQYNCQRLPIAKVVWDGTAGQFNVTQYLVGPIAVSNNIQIQGTLFYDNTVGTPPIPSWLTTRDFNSQQTSFEGAWSDCDKFSGGGLLPTVEVGP